MRKALLSFISSDLMVTAAAFAQETERSQARINFLQTNQKDSLESTLDQKELP